MPPIHKKKKKQIRLVVFVFTYRAFTSKKYSRFQTNILGAALEKYENIVVSAGTYNKKETD